MCEEFLVSYGGHEGAAGFTIEEGNIPSFAHAFEAACEDVYKRQTTNFLGLENPNTGLRD